MRKVKTLSIYFCILTIAIFGSIISFAYEYEPNGSISTATAISTNATNYAYIGSSSYVDYFSLDITSPSYSYCDIKLECPAYKDYDAILYNYAGTKLEELVSTYQTETKSKTLWPGRYYISVYGYNGAYSTTYTYGITLSTKADYDADARYREGGSLNYYGHAGLRAKGLGIYEIKGPYNSVELSTWTSFLDGKTFWGSCINPTMTDADRRAILGTAAALEADPEITYTGTDIIDYSTNPNGTYANYIEPDELTDTRCDGVVEYCYEWNNVWVWGRADTGTSTGTPQHHDVTYIPYLDEHNDLGSDEPWIETAPNVQMGRAGTRWTKMKQYW